MTKKLQSVSASGITRAMLSAHALEALGNYQSADQLLVDEVQVSGTDVAANRSFSYREDRAFWRNFVGINKRTPRQIDKHEIRISYAAVSEWVARIPGLYWSAASEKFRKVKPEDIESRTDNWVTYSPKGKSQKVSGGIGTIKLPPSNTGYRLVSLTTSLNVSSGAPALVSPDVWEGCNLKEGVVLNGNAKVRSMPADWAREFPSIKGIPRPCVVLDNPDSLRITEQSASILIHPFTVMEYWENDAQLLDFVYAATDSAEPGYRGDLEEFFRRYKERNGRDGNYLIAADVAQPMWDAEFASPADMRSQKNAGLNLIEKRVNENFNGDQVIEPLLAELTGVSEADILKQISELTGIRWQQWFRNGTLADEATRLVDAAVQSNSVAKLVQATEQVQI